MGDIGLARPQSSPAKIHIAAIGGAQSGAREPDPALAFVSRQWPDLTAEQRLRIVEIATAAPSRKAHRTQPTR